MPKIAIVGNSGAARECYWIMRDIFASSPEFSASHEFAGFFSWRGFKGDLKELASHFRGPLEEHEIDADELYIIGAGKPDLRADIYKGLKSRGAGLMNLIHPWSAIAPSASMGEGNIFQRGSTVYANASIGNGNYFNGAVNLAHDVSVGDFNFFAPYAIMLGASSMGSRNHLGPHAVVLEHARMGDGNLLTPGSVLYKGCRDNCRMSGNPALKIGQVEDEC